ncbi:MAG: hypothetical protein Q9168_001307 [Polycauliona sp. 1 TL-2023]
MDDLSGDFKWFGEGFKGFPKKIPDDCIEHALYVIDSDLSPNQIRAQLRKVQAAATALCKDMLSDFIWQRDEFCLELKHQDGLSFLQGRTNFGDSIEDEWLIVYLLRELSIRFPQSWIRVVDSDGEFLLAEAADTLPRWVNPEVMENRVWINNGRLLIIPKERQKDNGHVRGLTVDDAFKFIQTRETALLHIPAMESQAFYRIRKYPAQIQESLHQSLITIPRKLAYILHEKAAYIGPAVEAFYLRDPIALRPLQSPAPSRLLFPPQDFVTVSTKFTKVGFAQLKGQNFETPRAWTPLLGKVPSIFSQTGYQMGMKVTCGFEMLMSDPQNVDKKSVREINLLLDDLDEGEEELPSDQAISKWGSRDDDEGWLDVNFEQFEKELSGKGDQNTGGEGAGFGDKTAQENLRRMVSMFEKFQDEDDDEVQDADYLDDMDNDDDSDSVDSLKGAEREDDDNDKADVLDEDRFTTMMREMMGLPATDDPAASMANEDSAPMSGTDSNDGDEAKDIRKVMHEMEAELHDVGALSREPPPDYKTSGKKALPSLAASNGDTTMLVTPMLQKALQEQSSSDDDGDRADGELDINFGRAKQLLSQFKVT